MLASLVGKPCSAIRLRPRWSLSLEPPPCSRCCSLYFRFRPFLGGFRPLRLRDFEPWRQPILRSCICSTSLSAHNWRPATIGSPIFLSPRWTCLAWRCGHWYGFVASGNLGEAARPRAEQPSRARLPPSLRRKSRSKGRDGPGAQGAASSKRKLRGCDADVYRGRFPVSRKVAGEKLVKTVFTKLSRIASAT